VQSLRRPDRTIFIASHNLDELQRLADRVAIIDRGRLQRIVETRTATPDMPATVYHVVVARGAEYMGDVFPGSVALQRGEFELPPLEMEALNHGLSALIARGALVVSVNPAHSALETQFREAVGARVT
jgi:ABC-type multidrug transport system ATPase subunit